MAGLVPVYARHAAPSTISEAEHKLNPKRLLWMAYDKLLAQLMDSEELSDGFRYYFYATLALYPVTKKLIPA